MATYDTIGMGTYGATWARGGYAGAGNVASLLGSCADRPAAVCGSAATVFEDLDLVRIRLAFPDDLVVVAANDVGMFLPRLDHWVTLHTENMAAWKAVRWVHVKGAEDVKYHSIRAAPAIDYVWDGLRPVFALSGYFAMQIAYLLGCAPIVLCGCPGMQTPRFFETTARPDFGYGQGPAGSDRGIADQLVNEMRRLSEFKAVVRSMSGWTRDFFGGL